MVAKTHRKHTNRDRAGSGRTVHSDRNAMSRVRDQSSVTGNGLRWLETALQHHRVSV